MPHLDVICFGSATLDTIAVVDRYPAEDGRVEASAVVTAGGGPAATAAVTLARLGVSVGFAGVVGDDDAGEEIRRGLDAESVDTTWLRSDGSASGASVVVVVKGSGSRTIFTRPAPTPAELDVPRDVARWVHADQTGYAAARGMRSGDVRLSVDAGNPIPGLDLDDIELYAPTLQALRSEFPGTADSAAERAQAAGARMVVATDGARGAHYWADGAAGTIPASNIDVTSTLGAGDVFHGALLAALVWGADIRLSTEIATWVAAESCRALDGRSAIPGREMLIARFPALNDL